MLFFCQKLIQIIDGISNSFHLIPDNSIIFHTITTGHYWRNSYIKEFQLLKKEENGDYNIFIWKVEQEEDEYEMLKIISDEFRKSSLIYGYNSTSFHLPYLKNKYKAYGLEDPFTCLDHIDLLQKCKHIGKALNLSLKISDLRLYFQESDEEPEIRIIFDTLSLLEYEEFFNGNFTVEHVVAESDALLVVLESSINIHHALHINHPAFYLMLDQDAIKVQIRLFDGRLKVYYANYEDYYYLPEEDMIIHKSMASGISKDKKEKATYETCYNYTKLPDQFSYEYIKKYLQMIFKHLCNRN